MIAKIYKSENYKTIEERSKSKGEKFKIYVLNEQRSADRIAQLPSGADPRVNTEYKNKMKQIQHWIEHN